MSQRITEPTLNSHGDEVHPSFGLASMHRVSSHPAHHLFDSSIGHTEYVTLTVQQATRKRDLGRDRIHTAPGLPLIEIEMSLSQWGALVSSPVSRGTPVTIHQFNGAAVPAAPHASRLAVTAKEVSQATAKAVRDVEAAAAAVEAAFEDKSGRTVMRSAVQNLVHTVHNLPRNMQFAADALTEHAEEVVAKASVDIEAAREFGSRSLPGSTETELELEG